jgi:hypothetical protein
MEVVKLCGVGMNDDGERVHLRGKWRFLRIKLVAENKNKKPPLVSSENRICRQRSLSLSLFFPPTVRSCECCVVLRYTFP